MADEDDDRCGHEGCGCMVTGDNDYCSDHCRDASDQDMVEIACDCGHDGCAMSLQTEKGGPEPPFFFIVIESYGVAVPPLPKSIRTISKRRIAPMIDMIQPAA